MKKLLLDKRILIIGGTGSVGKVLVRRVLSGEFGTPAQVTVFSRDEAKQHEMRIEFMHRTAATDEIIYRTHEQKLRFLIGDVRSFSAVAEALRDADIVLHAAALKQVPTCEYFPYQAVLTNICGAENIIRAILEFELPVETVVGISTDKACKPVNVMGMTKAVQERVLIQANMRSSRTRFVCVRYGNVLASRGSVIPLFHDQIRNGGPVTLTTDEMTRFFLTLDDAVDTILSVIRNAGRGETYVPIVPSARMRDVATALIGQRKIAIRVIGIRPGEKIHEVLVSEEEAFRTVRRDDHYVILPILPELRNSLPGCETLRREYSSADNLLTLDQVTALLTKRRLIFDDVAKLSSELLT